MYQKTAKYRGSHYSTHSLCVMHDYEAAIWKQRLKVSDGSLLFLPDSGGGGGGLGGRERGPKAGVRRKIIADGTSQQDANMDLTAPPGVHSVTTSFTTKVG